MKPNEYEEARDRLLIKLAPLLNEVGEELNVVLEYVDKLEEAHLVRKEYVEAKEKFGDGNFMDFRYEREESERIYQLRQRSEDAYQNLEQHRAGRSNGTQ